MKKKMGKQGMANDEKKENDAEGVRDMEAIEIKEQREQQECRK